MNPVHRLFIAISVISLFLHPLPVSALVGQLGEPVFQNPVFACEPAGFTLMKEDKGLRLHGALPSPPKGYVYQVGYPQGDSANGWLVKLEMFKTMASQQPDNAESWPIDHLFFDSGDQLFKVPKMESFVVTVVNVTNTLLPKGTPTNISCRIDKEKSK